MTCTIHWRPRDDNDKDTQRQRQRQRQWQRRNDLKTHHVPYFRLKDIKYDGGRWTEGDDNDNDTRKDKDKDKDAMTKRPDMCHIFENDTTQIYQIRWWQNRQIHQIHQNHHIHQIHQNHHIHQIRQYPESECDEYIRIFEYSNILVTNIYSDIRSYHFFFCEYIRTFVRVKFVCTNIFGYSLVSVLECKT